MLDAQRNGTAHRWLLLARLSEKTEHTRNWLVGWLPKLSRITFLSAHDSLTKLKLESQLPMLGDFAKNDAELERLHQTELRRESG